MKTKLDLILTIILYSLIFLVILLAGISIYHRVQDKPFNFLGYSFSYVVSGSMYPTLEVGDVILSKNLNDYSDLGVDDIITYKSEEGPMQGRYITHRITDIIYENGDISHFETKGDVSNEPDEENVNPDQIKSIYIRRLEIFSFIVSIFISPLAIFILLLTPLIIFFIKHIKKLIKLLNE